MWHKIVLRNSCKELPKKQTETLMDRSVELKFPPLGKRIRKMRELYDYSQDYVAAALGMSVPGYSRIERDEVRITLDKLLIICRVLNITLSDLTHPNENQLYANWTLVNARYARFEPNSEELEKLEEAYKAQVQTLKEEVNYLRGLLSKVT